MLALALASGPSSLALLEDPTSATAAAPDTLNAERCADCHSAVVETYSRSGMARALEPIEPGELKGLGRVEDEPAGLTYYFSESKRGPKLIESWKTEVGGERQTVRVQAPLLFRIGAGILDRSYALKHGRSMWFAPLEVLSATAEGERHAALAPGHMMMSGTRFTTPITIECLACHTGNLPPRSFPHNLLPPPDWKPTGIACDVCHAGTEAHADWREREADGEATSGADPIQRHADLNLNQSLSLCARCHLQGDARVALKPGVRGIPAPGGDFLEEWAVYLPTTQDEDVAFVSQTERMLRSRCFNESLGAEPMTCTTCHDPHASVTSEKERGALRRACLQCHPAGAPLADLPIAGAPQADLPVGSAPQADTAKRASSCALPMSERADERDCVDCHMPLTGVFDVAHVKIRDHFVRAKPTPSTPGPLRVKHCRDGLLEPFIWPGGDATKLEADLGLQLMATIIGQQQDLAADFVDLPAGEISRKLPVYHHLRGFLLEGLGRTEDAIESYRRALVLDEDAPESRTNLALLLATPEGAAQGVELLDELLLRHPQAEGALRNRAILRLQLGDEEGFAEDLKAAYRVLPRGLLARALSAYHQGRGELDEAQGWEQEARRLDP